MKEWFKSKPYWLKGGMIGLIMSIFYSLFSLFKIGNPCGEYCLEIFGNERLGVVFMLITMLLGFMGSWVTVILAIILKIFGLTFRDIPTFILWINFIISYILLFALIGWIYRKIKNINRGLLFASFVLMLLGLYFSIMRNYLLLGVPLIIIGVALFVIMLVYFKKSREDNLK